MAAFSDVYPESISSLPLLSWAAPHPTSSPSPTDAQGAERVGCGGGSRRERERGAGSEVGGLLVYSLSTGLTRLYTGHQHRPPPPPPSLVREERNVDSGFKSLLLCLRLALDCVWTCSLLEFHF